MDHVRALCGDTWLELFGDRGFKDDKAMIGGLGKIDGQSYMIVGQQKVTTPKHANTATLDGKSRRLQKSIASDENGREIQHSGLTLIDTPGAYPVWKPKNADKEKRLPETSLK
jgi:acetyl-CoA carboxylase carboxyl transferase subunit alpha